MPSRFRFQTKQLNQNGGFDAINTGGQALKYIVPAARMLGNEKALRRLRKESVLTPETVSLYHGAVRDIPRPNLIPRYRPSQGSSLAEYVIGQKFADADARALTANYELNNAASRIDQENTIRNSKNQEIMTNVQLRNAARHFNASNAQAEKMQRMREQEELQLGLVETTQNDISQRNYIEAAQRASAASNILRYGDPNSPEYQRALKYFMGTLGEFKTGGKLRRKTKFSNGGN
jgi:hypothetical protein